MVVAYYNVDSGDCPGGRLGLLAPDPRQRAFGSLDSHSGGSGLVGGPARGGRAGLAGVTARGLRPFSLGAPRRGACGAPPIRHGTGVTPSPPGKGGWVTCARAGLPYGRPASRGVERSLSGAGGGDLLRRPTEATLAPPAIHRCGEPYLVCPVSPPTLPKPSQAHHPARSEGGPPVPPGRQQTIGITPQGAPSRPREEAISLAQHETPPPT